MQGMDGSIFENCSLQGSGFKGSRFHIPHPLCGVKELNIRSGNPAAIQGKTDNTILLSMILQKRNNMDTKITIIEKQLKLDFQQQTHIL